MSSGVSRIDLDAMNRDELLEHIYDLESRVEDLETEAGRLDTIAVRAIERAKDAQETAEDLVDDLPEEYHWILSPEELAQSQYGSIKRETSKAGKRIGIDIEGVHSAGCPVNRFTKLARHAQSDGGFLLLRCGISQRTVGIQQRNYALAATPC
jgi:16S rRNA G527 N7-methylase RsmG